MLKKGVRIEDLLAMTQNNSAPRKYFRPQEYNISLYSSGSEHLTPSRVWRIIDYSCNEPSGSRVVQSRKEDSISQCASGREDSISRSLGLE